MQRTSQTQAEPKRDFVAEHLQSCIFELMYADNGVEAMYAFLDGTPSQANRGF